MPYVHERLFFIQENISLSMPTLLKNQTLSICLFLALSLLTGCFSRPKPASPEEQNTKLTSELEKSGYQLDSSLEISSHREVWQQQTQEIEVVLTHPSKTGHYPLIIYLPSLGEDANGGKIWRESWARAGYSVFSLQPIAISQAVKNLKAEQGWQVADEKEILYDQQNEEAANNNVSSFFGLSDKKKPKPDRSSDIRYLGHEYFSSEQLKQRMTSLFWAYQQLQLKINSGSAEFSFIDTSKVILAGYDLGAQTVAAVIGENFMTELPNNPSLKPSAALLLSPSIDLAEGNVRNRFKNINTPMLVITSSDDNDPYAISSGSVRSAIWEFAPAGNKLLLLLTGAVHPLLSGTDLGGDFARRNLLKQQMNNPQAEQINSRGQNARGKSFAHYDEPGKKLKYDNAELGYKQVAAVISTSNAFLDIISKNDEFAKFWIQDKANKWLDRAGTLNAR